MTPIQTHTFDLNAVMRILLSLLLIVSCVSQATASSVKPHQAFVDKLVNQHGFDRQFVEQQLATVKKDQAVLDAISRPWEAKPWYQYRKIFLTDKRVQKGVVFWRQHQAALERAEQQLGVPAEIVVAIIGVETFYGTYTGKYSALDALYTLAFHRKRRSSFFKKELEQLFLLSREEQLTLVELKGSYAGALGWGQFISSSYRHYAIDFDGDGQRDLFNNPVDAIGSVANYFKAHRWQKGQPIALPASVSGTGYSAFIKKGLKPKTTWKMLQKAGVSIEQDLSPTTKVSLLDFELAEGKAYWLGLNNFYVITRYNHSPLYAMAVYQLSQQIKAAYQRP